MGTYIPASSGDSFPYSVRPDYTEYRMANRNSENRHRSESFRLPNMTTLSLRAVQQNQTFDTERSSFQYQ